MRKNNYLNRKSGFIRKSSFLLFTSLLVFQFCFGQTSKKRKFASSQSSGTIGFVISPTIDSASSAVDSDASTFSTLSMAVSFGSSFYQNLVFDSPIPDGKKVTVKIGLPNSVVDVLPTITAQGYNGSNPVGSPKSLAGLLGAISIGTNSQFELTLTGDGTWSTLRVSLTALAYGSSLNIYEAYYEEDDLTEDCNQFKTYDVISGVRFTSGLLDPILNVSGAIVNPLNMIDGDLNTYTELNRGILTAAGDLYTIIPFKSNWVSGDKVRFLIGSSNNLIDLNVLSAITVSTYMDDVAKESFTLNDSFIRLDLSGTGNEKWIEVQPTQEFNRVEIRLNSTVNLGLFNYIRIFEVQKIIASPQLSISSQNLTIYSGHTATLEATISGISDIVNWYLAGSNIIIGTGLSYTTPALTQSTTYDITTYRFNCLSSPSDITPATVTVLSITTTGPVDGNVNVSYSDDLQVGGLDAIGRTYAFTLDQGSLPPGLTLSSDGSISGTPTIAGPYTFTVDITDETDPNNILPVGNYSFSIQINGPLPISLAEFNAKIQEEEVLLSWITVSERNNKEFEIEKSLDGRKWNTVGTVVSKAFDGNSAQKLDYFFTDKEANNGYNFYRLKQIDYDGKFTYSAVKKVYFEGDFEIQVYPNPSTGIFHLNGLENGSQIEVMNASGKIMATYYPSDNSPEIDLQSYSSGIYYLIIQEINRPIKRIPLIKK